MPAYDVHTGYWVNYDRGVVKGATITLHDRNSQVLASFIGVFLTFVGVQLWRILAFIIHQARATNSVVDGLHRQQQLVWRNTNGPAASSWVFGKQLWAWRHHADGVTMRTLPLVTTGGIYAVGFAVLSIFASSELTKAAGSTRLVQPGRCGIWNLTDANSQANFASTMLKYSKDHAAANAYAGSCYPSSLNQSSATRCDLYRKPYINYTKTYTDVCPWPRQFCASNGTAIKPVVLDTGLTDSHYDWGINAAPNVRLQYRRVMTCSPISLKNYTEQRNKTNGFGNSDPYFYVNIGHVTNGGSASGDLSSNYTFAYDKVRALLDTSYSVDTASWSPDAAESLVSWDPIPELKRRDGEVTVVAIAGNQVDSTAPFPDPVFGSNLLLSNEYDATNGYNVTLYGTDYYIGVIACLDQYQACNPNNNTCTSLSTPLGVSNQIYANGSGYNVAQGNEDKRLFAAALETDLYKTVSFGGGQALKASQTLSGGFQYGKNVTWDKEVVGWFETALARMQQVVLEYATGPLNTDNYSPLVVDNNDVARVMCKAQMISLNDGSVSYSVLGLALVVGVGALIILLSFTIEYLAGSFQRLLHTGEHRRLAWILDSGFQLHRQVCESQGYGGAWANLEGEVPVCERGARFGGDGQAGLAELKTPLAEEAPFIGGPAGAPPGGPTGHGSTAYFGAGALPGGYQQVNMYAQEQGAFVGAGKPHATSSTQRL